MKSYSPAMHRHRFAAWCAATAASASPKCRFPVKVGVRLIEAVNLDAMSISWEKLPEPEIFDDKHNDLCVALIGKAESTHDISGSFTYGVAAKMVNCYLKALYYGVPQGNHSVHQTRKLNAIHPPVDRLLLRGLARQDVGGHGESWRFYELRGWSNFNYKEYKEVIKLIHEVTDGDLWMIEAYWQGFQ